MSRSRSRLARASVAVAGLLFASTARADDVNSLLEVLEENVVSGASRSAERSTDAPATSSVVNAEQLRRFGIRRLDEAINYFSLGMFSHDRLSTSEVGARGLTLTRDMNSHVLVVLDGMIVNEQGGGAVYLHDIPIEVIDHIEFILGPGSVLYGGQAMLGVINVVTKSAKDSEGYRASASLGLSPPLDDSGAIRTPSASTLGHDHRFSLGVARVLSLGRPVSVTASLDYADFNGPQIAFAPQSIPRRPDGTPVLDPGPNSTAGAWGGPVNDQWYRRTAGGYLKVDVGDVTWSTRATTSRAAMPQMDLFENRVGGIYDDPRNVNKYATVLSNLRFQKRLSARTTGVARSYFGYSNTAFERIVLGHDAPVAGVPLGVIDPEQCPTGPVGPCRKETHFLSRWVGAELQLNHDWFGDGAYTTMFGADARLRTAAYEFVTFDVESGKSYGSDPAVTRWHAGGNKVANEYAIGPYVQQVLKPHKMLAINAGLRLDYDTRMNGRYLGDALSPRLALIFTPSEQFSLRGIYSRAFRAPSFFELYAVSGRLLPNPNGLQPETVSSYEVVGTLRLGAHAFALGGFYAKWQNLIELRIVKAQAPNVSRYENAESIDNYGTNLSYETALFNRRVRPALNFTMAASRRHLSAQEQSRNAAFGADDTAPVTVAPSVYGNARVSMSLDAQDRTVLALAAGYFGRRIADQAYYGGDQSNLAPRPEAPPMLTVRGVLTGDVPWWAALGYTVGFDYAFGSAQPYVIGPNQGLPAYLSSAPVEGHLAPINRLTAFVGLELKLGVAAADAGLASAQTPTASPATAPPIATGRVAGLGAAHAD